jgi:minor extracellular serine protease Vpr
MLNTRLTKLGLLISVVAYGVAFIRPAEALPPGSNRWVVMLNDPPVLQKYPGRIEKTRAAAAPYRQYLQQMQDNVRGQIESMNIRVTGAVEHVMNALFVTATPQQAEAIRMIPGVKSVSPMRQYHLEDQLSLSHVQAAWNAAAIGGESNAGAGMKIAIIDTGIDQTHPSFNDPSLKIPAGYPKCDVQSNCTQYTNNKVIVARSYVSDIVNADVTNSSDPAAQSRPDDLSARDLIGHGTAVASVAAAFKTTFNGSTVEGVAPKAYLGNYKIFASNEVNPNGSGNIVQALDDAITDGMDVINLSLGSPAFSGPLDTGSACGLSAGQQCDPLAYAIEQVVTNGQVVVVAAAGNEGDTGYQFNIGCSTPPCFSAPTFATVGSPAYAPSALAAGGVENDVTYAMSVQVTGAGVPSNLQQIAATASADGPVPASMLTAPLIDVTKAGDPDGLLCAALSPTALANDIALVERGRCNFSVKVANAQNAGALGVVFIDNGTGLGGWTAGTRATIPSFLIGVSDGQNLKSYVDGNPGAQVALNPNPFQLPASALGYVTNSVVSFASRGPVPGINVVKPDVSAVATDFLLAAEYYDPYGDLFSLMRYSTADGTSFSTPMLAGAAALVKQAIPNLTPLQIKSALVNTGSLSGLTTSDGSAPAAPTELGSGLLQAQNAVISTVQFVPSSVSFGVLKQGGSLPAAETLTVSNTGTSSVTLSMSATASSGHSTSTAQVHINNAGTASVTVPAGKTTNITVSLSGAVPSPGRYEGVITANGGQVPLTIPYLFVVGDGVAYDTIPLDAAPPATPGTFDGPVGAQIPCVDSSNCVSDYGPIGIRVIDQYGAPVVNAPVQWTVTQGGGTVQQGSQYTNTTTDQNGLAFATVTLGPTPGTQEFTATVAGMGVPFDGNARAIPAIGSPGVVDAASFNQGKPVAPGSWIAIYGNNLSDTTDLAFANCPQCTVVNQPLPMGIDGVAFSFDVPSAGISVPGRFNYVSAAQLNVQVPWELQGQTSATVKVIVNYTYGAEYTLPLAQFSPGIFVTDYTSQQAAALDGSNQIITPSNPVARGGVVQLFLNGLGPVNNQPADGAPGPPNTSATTQSQPTITVGGQTASIQYSGLAPNFVGLYQINFTVPQGVGTGQQPIICSIGGVTSKTAYLSVK